MRMVVLAIALLSVCALRCATPSDNRPDGAPYPERPASLTFDTTEVNAGATLRVYGHGFCVEERCSAVTIVIDGQAVAQEVRINSDGMFTATVFVPAITHSGSIPVAAEQTRADGSQRRVFARLFVTPGSGELQ